MAICQNYKCKKNIPDGTKKCSCGWVQKGLNLADNKGKEQSTLTLTVSRPRKEADDSFTVYAYAIARHGDDNLAKDGHQVVFHSDDLEEFAEQIGAGECGRADHIFSIPAERAGENVVITAHTQINGKRYEATKTVVLPKEKEKTEPPKKKATGGDFFATLEKYKGGGK